MSQIILTLYDFSGDGDRSKKFAIEPNLIVFAKQKTFSEGDVVDVVSYVGLKDTVYNLGSHLHVFETPEEIAALVTSSLTGPTKFIKLHAIKSGEARPICLNIDKIESFYPKDNETFHDKLPDSLSPENVDKNYLTEIHFKVGNSSVSYEFLESYDYICRMLSAK